MTALLVASGMGLLILPGLLVSRWDHLSPREWTRLNWASLTIGLWAVRAGLTIGATPTLLRAAGVEHAAAACHELFGPVLPGGAAIGWASAAAIAAVEYRIHRSKRRGRAALEVMRVEAWLGTHSTVNDIEVIRLPVQEPLAYALAGPLPQVVISDGLVEVLSEPELRAVVRHECSHIEHGHQRHLELATSTHAAIGWIRPVQRSIDALRLGVERWADEDAVELPAERHFVRTALVKVTASMLGPALSFTTGCTILDRMRALDREAPAPTATSRAVAVVPLLSLTAIVAATLIAWSSYSHHGLLALVGYCPF